MKRMIVMMLIGVSLLGVGCAEGPDDPMDISENMTGLEMVVVKHDIEDVKLYEEINNTKAPEFKILSTFPYCN